MSAVDTVRKTTQDCPLVWFFSSGTLQSPAGDCNKNADLKYCRRTGRMAGSVAGSVKQIVAPGQFLFVGLCGKGHAFEKTSKNA